MSKHLERLKAKQAEIRAKIKDLETKTSKKVTEAIKKKRQIIGEYFLNKYKDKTDELKRMLDPVLKRVGDRKLFGLKPKVEEKKEDSNQSSYWKK